MLFSSASAPAADEISERSGGQSSKRKASAPGEISEKVAPKRSAAVGSAPKSSAAVDRVASKLRADQESELYVGMEDKGGEGAGRDENGGGDEGAMQVEDEGEERKGDEGVEWEQPGPVHPSKRARLATQASYSTYIHDKHNLHACIYIHP